MIGRAPIEGGLFGPPPLAGGPPRTPQAGWPPQGSQRRETRGPVGPRAPPRWGPQLQPLPEFLSLRFLKTETMTSRLPKMSTTVVKISTPESTVTTQAGRGAPAASRSAKPKRLRPPGSQQFLREPFSSIADTRRCAPAASPPCPPGAATPLTDRAGGREGF